MAYLMRFSLNRSRVMAVCYNKLWKMLIDKNMSKTKLIKAAKISTNAMAKMGKIEMSELKYL